MTLYVVTLHGERRCAIACSRIPRQQDKEWLVCLFVFAVRVTYSSGATAAATEAGLKKDFQFFACSESAAVEPHAAAAAATAAGTDADLLTCREASADWHLARFNQPRLFAYRESAAIQPLAAATTAAAVPAGGPTGSRAAAGVQRSTG